MEVLKVPEYWILKVAHWKSSMVVHKDNCTSLTSWVCFPEHTTNSLRNLFLLFFPGLKYAQVWSLRECILIWTTSDAKFITIFKSWWTREHKKVLFSKTVYKLGKELLFYYCQKKNWLNIQKTVFLSYFWLLYNSLQQNSVPHVLVTEVRKSTSQHIPGASKS